MTKRIPELSRFSVFAAHPLSQSLLFCVAIFLALQAWRPCFFLTDDNLSVGLPFLTELGRHLNHGQPVAYSDYLFGGHYNMWRDANYFWWSPINFVVAPLAETPFRFLMFELLALPTLLLATAGFVRLALALREELRLPLSDGWIVFFALSFVYSTFALTCGASWLSTLTDQAALPWLALALWTENRRQALGMLVLIILFEVLGGQPGMTISNLLIMTLLAGMLCLYRRSTRPLQNWVLAHGVAFLGMMPILLPMVEGFEHAQRSHGIAVEAAQACAMPAWMLASSFLFGNFFAIDLPRWGIDSHAFLVFPRLPTQLACAAAWCAFPVLLNRRRWTSLETGCLALIVLLTVLIVRPDGVTRAMLHVPVLRSMRWPFREILQLSFFFHLLLILRPAAGTRALRDGLAFASLTFFVAPMFFSEPFTLNPLRIDRQALFSGEGDRFWNRVRPLLQPGDQLAVAIDPALWQRSLDNVSYVHMGTANFPAYFRIPTISGYSQASPVDQLPVKFASHFWFGAYAPDQIPDVLRQCPNVRVLRVDSMLPLRVTLSNRTGPPTDLTPLLLP